MAQSPKTISIRHLHAAVKAAIEATAKDHPSLKTKPLVAGPILPIYIRFPWIAGIPPFPFEEAELAALGAATKRFAAALATDQHISALGLNGKFEPAMHVTGNSVSIGVVPADVSLTE
jgi:hypothetical protein